MLIAFNFCRNLEGNQLSGPFPVKLLERSNDGSLLLRYFSFISLYALQICCYKNDLRFYILIIGLRG